MTTAADLRLQRRFESEVRRSMAADPLWPARGPLLLAVSGGQDSLAMLLAVQELAAKQGRAVAVAHFDHGLRGAEASARERSAVEAACAALGLPLSTGAWPLEQRARGEQAARAARYDFLARAAAETGAEYVATGHTASDQAETVLLHAVRGSGLAGLGGMRPRSPWPFPGRDGLTLVRPLLTVSRQDTLAYCLSRGVTPAMDESNASKAYLRNRVRNRVMPLLRELNPRVEDALNRLAAAARRDEEALSAMASAGYEAAGGRLRWPRQRLRSLPEGLLARSFLAGLAQLTGSRLDIGERHVQALARLARQGRTGDALDLPFGLQASLLRDALVIGPPPLEDAALPAEPVCLPVPGRVRFGGLVVEAALAGTEPPPEGEVVAAVDAEAAGTRLRVRRRRPGDRFQPPGLPLPKKLQDFFVDEHVPRVRRDCVPLFESDRGILWVGGLRVAGWGQARDGRPSLRLSFRPSA